MPRITMRFINAEPSYDECCMHVKRPNTLGFYASHICKYFGITHIRVYF